MADAHLDLLVGLAERLSHLTCNQIRVKVFSFFQGRRDSHQFAQLIAQELMTQGLLVAEAVVCLVGDLVELF